MKSIISTIMTAALLLSALSACGRSNVSSRTEEARVTPNTAVTETSRPAATATPGANTNGDNGTVGNAIGNAAENAGDAIGDVVSGAGNAVGNAVGAVGNAMDDMVDDTVDDTRGVNGTMRTGRTGVGTGRTNP